MWENFLGALLQKHFCVYRPGKWRSYERLKHTCFSCVHWIYARWLALGLLRVLSKPIRISSAILGDQLLLGKCKPWYNFIQLLLGKCSADFLWGQQKHITDIKRNETTQDLLLSHRQSTLCMKWGVGYCFFLVTLSSFISISIQFLLYKYTPISCTSL